MRVLTMFLYTLIALAVGSPSTPRVFQIEFTKHPPAGEAL